MEEVLKKLVNAGIGAVKTIQEKYGPKLENLESNLTSHFEDLVKKGESANDSISAKIKEGVETFANFTSKAQAETTKKASNAKAKSKSKPKASAKKKAEAKIDSQEEK